MKTQVLKGLLLASAVAASLGIVSAANATEAGIVGGGVTGGVAGAVVGGPVGAVVGGVGGAVVGNQVTNSRSRHARYYRHHRSHRHVVAR